MSIWKWQGYAENTITLAKTHATIAKEPHATPCNPNIAIKYIGKSIPIMNHVVAS